MLVEVEARSVAEPYRGHSDHICRCESQKYQYQTNFALYLCEYSTQLFAEQFEKCLCDYVQTIKNHGLERDQLPQTQYNDVFERLTGLILQTLLQNVPQKFKFMDDVMSTWMGLVIKVPKNIRINAYTAHEQAL